MVKLLRDRTISGLEAQINALSKQGYEPKGSFTRSEDKRWYFQTMVPASEAKKAVSAEKKAATPKKKAGKKA